MLRLKSKKGNYNSDKYYNIGNPGFNVLRTIPKKVIIINDAHNCNNFFFWISLEKYEAKL